MKVIGYQEVPVEELELNGENVRVTKTGIGELEDSIIEHGILQPLVVRRHDGGQLTVVAGGRRFTVAQSLGLQTVPAIVKEMSDQEAFIESLVENIQRESLEPEDEWAGVARVVGLIGTQEGAGEKLGKSRQWVGDRMGAYEFVIRMRGHDRKVQVPRDPLKVRYIRTTAEVLFPDDVEKQTELYEVLMDRPRLEVRRVLAEMQSKFQENPNIFEVKSIEDVVRGIMVVVNVTVEVTFPGRTSQALMKVARERGVSWEEVVVIGVSQWLHLEGYLD